MCGINGFNFIDRKAIKKMNNAIKHRGPDSEGIFIDNEISLGHRRLAVIDLSKKGCQPMKFTHKSKKALIVFNGEIYNFNKLKKILLKKGYKFKSKTDTEVIIASYFEWGENFVNKLNGMWAFCIYDLQKKRLFLSRDRLGQKPLYYFFDGKKFIFSSEIKGILKVQKKQKISKKAVDLYLSTGCIPAPYSIYEKIKKINPRENIIFNLKSKELIKKNYFQLPKYSPINNEKKLVKEGEKILKDSIKLRKISDVPIGVFLSGGLDSSWITFELKKIHKNLSSFSIGFKGEYDESENILEIKNKLKLKHNHKYFLKKDFKKILPNIFYYYDEPFADISMFPTIFLSEFSNKKITVALSGDGGDEIFGGYLKYTHAKKIEILRKVPKKIRAYLLKILPHSKKFITLKRGLNLSLKNPKEIYLYSKGEKIYYPQAYRDYINYAYSKCSKLCRGSLSELFLMMDKYFLELPEKFLYKVDRASMANSLEVRSPFLDYRFIDYSSKIPASKKNSITKTKILMKKMVFGKLPKKIVKGKKKGFSPPVKEWVLQEYSKKFFENLLKKYSKKNLISEEWERFFLKEVLKKNDLEEYLIRLFLFDKWHSYWIKN